MTGRGLIQPTHRSIRRYYERLEALRNQGVLNEMSIRTPFEFLLEETAKVRDWTFVAELAAESGGSLVRPDGTLRDHNSLPRGYWEAKDSLDDLDREIQRKTARGYKLTNTIFEDTETGILFQDKREILRVPLGDPRELAELLSKFYSYSEPDIEGFEQAVDEFKEHVPDLATGLAQKIQEAHQSNPAFIEAFANFFKLCQTALNPNIRVEAVDEMLVQHLLTERLIRTIFDNPEFTKRNAIAQEVERVIEALVSKSFNRSEYLKSLDRFYVAIEAAARTLPDFSEKQHFLNTVYERFFQGYSVKLADTHGIVYTPQPIVDFMCASVAEVLEKEFGKSLASPDVYIIDPCTGTGNFIVNLLRRVSNISKRDLPRMYREQFFANEVMLLPYYIAALNIEHAYYELSGTYEPFEGLCFVDTLELAEAQQGHLYMSEKNAERVERQKRAPITVVIGNPPYHVGQLNENDNNKSRKYPVIERRVSETYAKASKASNKNALSDPYVKFFRWATDRLQGRDGIVAFVSNNSFVDQYAFDGMRKHLLQDFTEIYHVDLHGNVRRNPKLSGTTHNVFGIQVGVGITIAIRKKGAAGSALRYFRVPEDWRKEEKLGWLAAHARSSGEVLGAAAAEWRAPVADAKNSWVAITHADEYASFIPTASPSARSGSSASPTIFKAFSRGIETCRDEWAYDFNVETLERKIQTLADNYNSEVDRWRRNDKPDNLDDFVTNDPTRVKWCSRLKQALRQELYAEFHAGRIKGALYRPYSKRFVYVDPILTHRRGVFPRTFPNAESERDNRILWLKSGMDWPFFALASNRVVDVLPQGGSQCFPFYTYDEDGTNRRENFTDWALQHFRQRYHDATITKWDIFYYVYGILHHPEYRSKYAENLKRELPRIPLLGGGVAQTSASQEVCGLSDAPATDRRPSGNPRSALPGAEPVILRSEAPKNLTLKEDKEQEILRSAQDDRGDRGRSGGGVFWAVSRAGKELTQLHINYEKLEPYPLRFLENRDVPLSYRVDDKMRLSKDKASVNVNKSLTLAGIPPEAFGYRLGNRSALEWVIDQYQVTEDKKSGIHSDPNRADDPEYIVRLIGQVIRVSLETVRIVNNLRGLPLE